SEVCERALGAREVEEDVGARQPCGDVRGDGHTRDPAHARACVVSEQRAAGNFERTREREPGICQRGLEQRLAHPAAGAGDAQPHWPHQPSFFSRSWSQLVSPVFGARESDLSSLASLAPPPSATWVSDGGSSLPSQRASLSSTK